MTLSQEDILKLIDLRGHGFSQLEISNELGISRKTVENHLKKLKSDYKPVSSDVMIIQKEICVLIELIDKHIENRSKNYE